MAVLATAMSSSSSGALEIHSPEPLGQDEVVVGVAEHVRGVRSPSTPTAASPAEPLP